jgi:hypothetical protein
MDIQIKTPEKCSATELNAFRELVLSAEQVPAGGLAERIRSCLYLGFAYHADELIAVTGVKQPAHSYRRRIFEKAGVADQRKDFTYEIGYAFTKPAYRGRGIHRYLVSALVSETTSGNFFATTKVANVPRILETLGFTKCGTDYKNDDDETLQLFTMRVDRDAKQKVEAIGSHY